MIHSLVELRGETAHGLFALESCETAYMIQMLMKYEERCYSEPKRSWDPDEFRKRCYERSAIEQLALLVRLNQDMTFNEICEEFLHELEIPYESYETPTEVFEVITAVYETVLDVQLWAQFI